MMSDSCVGAHMICYELEGRVVITNKGIFISTPISGFQNESDYLTFRGVVLQLIKRLQERPNVCYEIEIVYGKDSYDSQKNL